MTITMLYLGFSGDSDGDSDDDDSGSIGGLLNKLIMAKLVHDLAGLSTLLSDSSTEGEDPSSSQRSESSTTPNATDAADLEEKTNIRICGICMDRERNAVFVTCGHGSCMKCSQSLKICHTCRAEIKSVVQTYD